MEEIEVTIKAREFIENPYMYNIPYAIYDPEAGVFLINKDSCMLLSDTLDVKLKEKNNEITELNSQLGSMAADIDSLSFENSKLTKAMANFEAHQNLFNRIADNLPESKDRELFEKCCLALLDKGDIRDYSNKVAFANETLFLQKVKRLYNFIKNTKLED